MKSLVRITAAMLAASSLPTGADSAAPASHWARSVNSGDAADIAGLYTEDAVLVSPGAEIIATPAAIGEYWVAKRRSGATGFRLVSVNERQEGDILYQSAAWITTFSSNGRASVFDGQMTNVLKRQPDGTWKIRLQSWN
jgi:ketosteroid isomerase-like protein